ncbi:MAG: hypothetical protein FJ358_02660 [Thaumarchaeota archaeon]|nr:hypothetical protein [Nitrososphaerota archaeon]
MKGLTVTLLLIVGISFVHAADAHIVGGLNKDIGQYRVQFISYPQFPFENERAVLFFNIQNNTNGLDLFNQTASVTILKEGNLIDSFPEYNANYANVMLNYTFPSAGVYTVRLDVLSAPVPVRADFPVEVGSGSTSSYIMVMIIVGLLTAIIIVPVFRKRKMKREKDA